MILVKLVTFLLLIQFNKRKHLHYILYEEKHTSWLKPSLTFVKEWQENKHSSLLFVINSSNVWFDMYQEQV